MTIWMLATLALLPVFAVGVTMACRGDTVSRLVAVQFATAAASLLLVLFTFAFDQSAFIDLPLTLTILTLPGTLLISVVLERWL